MNYSTRRLPGRRPASMARLTVTPDAKPVTKVAIVGRLVGAEGNDGLEVLHLDLAGTLQTLEQRDLTRLVSRRVVVTVELSALDGAGSREGEMS